MLETNTNAVTVLYSGGDIQVPFLFYDAADLVVLFDTTRKTLGTDYTVSGAGNDAGGRVSLVNPPAEDTRVTVMRLVDFVQLLEIPSNGIIPEGALNRALDRIVMMIQQLSEQAARAVTYPAGTDKSLVLNIVQILENVQTATANAQGSASAAAASADEAREFARLAGVEHAALVAAGDEQALRISREGLVLLNQAASMLANTDVDQIARPSIVSHENGAVIHGGTLRASEARLAYAPQDSLKHTSFWMTSDEAGENVVYPVHTEAGLEHELRVHLMEPNTTYYAFCNQTTDKDEVSRAAVPVRLVTADVLQYIRIRDLSCFMTNGEVDPYYATLTFSNVTNESDEALTVQKTQVEVFRADEKIIEKEYVTSDHTNILPILPLATQLRLRVRVETAQRGWTEWQTLIITTGSAHLNTRFALFEVDEPHRISEIQKTYDIDDAHFLVCGYGILGMNTEARRNVSFIILFERQTLHPVWIKSFRSADVKRKIYRVPQSVHVVGEVIYCSFYGYDYPDATEEEPTGGTQLSRARVLAFHKSTGVLQFSHSIEGLEAHVGHDMSVDISGVYLCGYVSGGFAMAKYTPTTRTLVWKREYYLPTGSCNIQKQSSGAHGLVIAGITAPRYGHNYLAKINQSSGAVLSQKTFNVASTDTFYCKGILHTSEGIYFYGNTTSHGVVPGRTFANVATVISASTSLHIEWAKYYWVEASHPEDTVKTTSECGDSLFISLGVRKNLENDVPDRDGGFGCIRKSDGAVEWLRRLRTIGTAPYYRLTDDVYGNARSDSYLLSGMVDRKGFLAYQQGVTAFPVTEIPEAPLIDVESLSMNVHTHSVEQQNTSSSASEYVHSRTLDAEVTILDLPLIFEDVNIKLNIGYF
ncbi:hypothetical protein [Halodesulfovibrio spirochaetisodalis]|uniref:Tail fiber protein n=1 Tax=Halodesulfovibrio spirochaetisodalis TaxID=1560234 RepID=A0A1B7XAR1_9BACT|nr:hypothetical protein [Halodesulfovibrio spirochaetisodalis]OBQ46461.1 hypothetical protein SP90_12180 [Halodesulfovibrio spirochaetisodalis]